MKIGLDSATPPTTAEVQAARVAGIAVWSGYLATRPLMRLARPWTQAEFAVVKALPGQPIAFASGWDDPAACKALAAAWGVRLCLDVEAGIRPDGSWVQAWLDASGAGLYGTQYVHTNRGAAFHIAAWYIATDPRAAWPNWPKPTAPCGWQWQNTHTEFGVGVDRSWLDDWFVGGSAEMTRDDFRALFRVACVAARGGEPDPTLLDNFTNNYTGSNAEALIAQLIDDPTVSQPYLKQQAAVIKAGPGGGKPTAPYDATITPK